MTDFHSNLGHTIYIDLLQSHLDEPVSSIRGSLSSEERNGKVYWYDSYRIGTKTIKEPLGEENPELLNRIRLHEKKRRYHKEIHWRRRIMIKHLQVESYQKFDVAVGSMLNALSTIGFFRAGGMLAGTTAFKCYECVLGARFDSIKHGHTEIDDYTDTNHVVLTMPEARIPRLKKAMAALDFKHIPTSHGRVKTSWHQSCNKTNVEFLTLSPEDFSWHFGLPAVSSGNMPSRLLYFLTYKPVQAVALYRGGVLVNVPQPERFAIYKLIMAGRQRNRHNRKRLLRDLLQSLWLTNVLSEVSPKMLRKAFKDAVKIDSDYIDLIRNSIEREPMLHENLASINLKV